MLARKIFRSLPQAVLIIIGGTGIMLMFTLPGLAQKQEVQEEEIQLRESESITPQEENKPVEAMERLKPTPSEGTQNSSISESEEIESPQVDELSNSQEEMDATQEMENSVTPQGTQSSPTSEPVIKHQREKGSTNTGVGEDTRNEIVQ